ncbi:MAG: flagellar hook-associated protein FlgK [Marinicaulis sp.]|nr:flagellar hook-associated protein FlgK [Marinicaulis sp.]
MSLTVALNTAVSGLLANQEAIAATSENIANVNTADFKRREARFFTDAIPNQFSGVGVEIERAGVNRFLQNAGFAGASDASSTSVVAEALSRVEASLGAPGDNISFAHKLDEAFAAFTALSATPNSIAAKAVAIDALDAAFGAFSRTINAIDDESVAADARLQAQADRANTLLEDIYNLNQIAPDSIGAGDEIDARLKELSTLIDINVSRADDGRVTVTTGDGQLLANSGGFRALNLTGGAASTIGLSSVDPASGATAPIAADINASLTGGEIGGLLALRNTELPALRTIVDTAARDIAGQINTVYAGNASVGATAPATTPLIIETDDAFTVNAVIAGDPAQLAIARPTGGAAGGANDGSGAGAIAALGATPEAQNVISAVTQIGAASRVAEERSTTAAAFASEVELRLLNEGGVNLDEELSNLILFQRSYSANARVIAAVDELYQSLLNIL